MGPDQETRVRLVTEPGHRVSTAEPRASNPASRAFAADRYADARARRNHAGTAPITRASGTSRPAVARLARNTPLFDACHQWALCALTRSPGGWASYDAHDPGPHAAKVARCKLANTLVGILRGCLAHRMAYDEDVPWSRTEERLVA